jgi:hypothetical protein
VLTLGTANLHALLGDALVRYFEAGLALLALDDHWRGRRGETNKSIGLTHPRSPKTLEAEPTLRFSPTESPAAVYGKVG